MEKEKLNTVTYAELKTLEEQYKHQKSQRKGAILQRHIEMATLRYKDGLTLQQIADRYGIIRQRAHQILSQPL